MGECKCRNPILDRLGDGGPRCCRRCWKPLPGYRVGAVALHWLLWDRRCVEQEARA